jgi:hypothetical protein
VLPCVEEQSVMYRSGRATRRMCACVLRKKQHGPAGTPKLFAGNGAMASKKDICIILFASIQRLLLPLNCPLDFDHRKQSGQQHSGCGQRKAGNVPSCSSCVAGGASALGTVLCGSHGSLPVCSPASFQGQHCTFRPPPLSSSTSNVCCSTGGLAGLYCWHCLKGDRL